MTKTKPNGDIYVLGIRTYSGAEKRPVRWVYGLMVALVTTCFYIGVYGVLSVNI